MVTQKQKKGQSSWSILKYLKLQHPKKWIYLRDFNEILYQNEKLGGARRNEKQMESFREVMQDCKLRDLGFTNGKYTLANNKLDQSFTNERLNRVIANATWCNIWKW